MGKAIVVSIALIIIIGIIAFVIRRSVSEATQVGDLNLKQERKMHDLLQSAAMIFNAAGVSFEIEDTDIISDRTQAKINNWLVEYNRYIKSREINA